LGLEARDHALIRRAAPGRAPQDRDIHKAGRFEQTLAPGLVYRLF
jgi:hypothetical protein